MAQSLSSEGVEVADPSESQQSNIIACAVITWLISAVVVATRMYLRGCLMKLLGPEDWLILAACLFSLALSINYIISAILGFGRHYNAVPHANFRLMLQSQWLKIILYTTSLCLSKVSVLLLYLRILTYEWTRKVLWVFLVFAVLASMVTIALDITACIPLNAFWDTSVHPIYCHSSKVYIAIGGLQIGTDFLIFLVPLPVIWTIRAPRDQKIVLSLVFSFAFLICIVSVVRLVRLATIVVDVDYSYRGVDVTYWSIIEVNTAIVGASVMTLKPLFSRMRANPLRHQPGHCRKDAPETSGHPLTVGSKSVRTGPTLAARQSWTTLQLARLDRIASEGSAACGDDVNLKRPESVSLAPPRRGQAAPEMCSGGSSPGRASPAAPGMCGGGPPGRTSRPAGTGEGGKSTGEQSSTVHPSSVESPMAHDAVEGPPPR